MRSNKKVKRSKGRSIDGIVNDGRRLDASGAVPPSPNQSQPMTSLGGTLRRAEGFHPVRSGSGSLGTPAGRHGAAVDAEQTSELLDEPIILDEPTVNKNNKRARRRWHFKWGFKRTVLTLLVLILVGGMYLGFKAYKTQRHVLAGGGQAPAVCDGNVPVNQLKTEGDGRVNVLLLGLGGEEHAEGPYATDTIIIASIDPINDKMDLLSIPRDLWVKIARQGSAKINAAYLYGRESSGSNNDADQQKSGINLVDQTLEPIIGVPIHYHAVVDFEAFRQSVNALGGVDINVPKELAVKESLWDEGTRKNYQLNVSAGEQHFDGTRALFFARSRYTSAGGDFDRSERQRLMLVAIKDKALSAGTLTNPIKISSLLDSLGNNVYTDFDSGSMKCIAKQISEIQSSNITSLDLVTPPHDLLASGNISDISTLVPKSGIYNYTDIKDYIRSSLRDGFIARENSSIAVYNATSLSGLATKEANLLKSYGYYVTTVDSLPNPTDPAKSTLIDLSGGADKYTRHYLEQRLGVTAQNSLPGGLGITPPSGTKFVIIAGKDAQNPSQ